MEKISRKGFLKIAAAAAMSGVTAAGLAACNGASSSSSAAGLYTPGTYSATATGMGTVTVTMTFDANSITDVKVDVSEETANIGGVQGVGQSIVELPFHGDAHAGHDTFQRHALALLAGVLPQEHLLQVVPDGGLALINVAEEKILLEHRHVIHAPLGKLGVRAAPLHEAAQALHDGFAPVQVGLGQAGDLGDVVLQLAEDAGLQMDGKGVQDVGVLVDLHGTDLYDLAPEGLLDAVIIEGIRLIADVPFQIK